MHSTRPFFFSFFLKPSKRGEERGGKQSSRVLRWIIVEKITETVKLIERERGSGEKGMCKKPDWDRSRSIILREEERR